MGNDEKEGEMTKISKQPRCDHRDLMKERADILDKSRQFLEWLLKHPYLIKYFILN